MWWGLLAQAGSSGRSSVVFVFTIIGFACALVLILKGRNMWAVVGLLIPPLGIPLAVFLSAEPHSYWATRGKDGH